MGTKHLDAESIRRHMASYDLHEKKGRPGAAPGETRWGPQVDDDEVANQTAPTAPKVEKEKVEKKVRWKDQVDSGALDLWGVKDGRAQDGLGGAPGRRPVGKAWIMVGWSESWWVQVQWVQLVVVG